MLSDEFINMTRCPQSGGPLRLAEESLLSRVNRAIATGRMKNRLGERLTAPLDGGLVNEDRSLLYPIVDEIPNLISEEAVVLESLEG